ncbi:MAG: hypothetical protein JXB47_01515 [Anaerolineae bacterium]|nr:hypothetical protein [Anaerolineae bacterium]
MAKVTRDYWILVCGVGCDGRALIETIGDVRRVTLTDLYPRSEIPFDLALVTTLHDGRVYLATPAAPLRGRLWMTMPNLMGFVIVIDEAPVTPETLKKVSGLLCDLHNHARKPYLIAADSSANVNGFSPDDLRATLDLNDETPIVLCNTADPKSVTDMLVELVYKMIG